MALGALIIMTLLRLTDEELVEQIKENPYLQFFICLKAFQDSAPFDPSMMVYFRKRLPEAIINDCNARIVRHGLAVIQSETAEGPDDDQDDQGAGVPCSGVIPPAPPPRCSRGGPRTSGDRHHG
jgi:transposase, IS5 family